jgi:hypothetical protein
MIDPAFALLLLRVAAVEMVEIVLIYVLVLYQYQMKSSRWSVSRLLELVPFIRVHGQR